MFLEDQMAGLGGYLGTSADIAAMLVSVILLIVVLAILVAVVDMEGLPLFFVMLCLLGLFTVFLWFPSWVSLFIFFISLVYMFFGADIGYLGR